MNNPIRRFIQSTVEISRIKELINIEKNKNILEIGCGSGYGTQLIQKHFQPSNLNAIDLDPRMIELAGKNNKNPNVFFTVASVTKLPFKSGAFDAVVDFGIIHHIPDWKKAIKEIARVTKPGGNLILEDLSIESFQTIIGRLIKKLLDHPYKKMFSEESFTKELEKKGIMILKKKSFNNLGLVHYFVIIGKKRLK